MQPYTGHLISMAESTPIPNGYVGIPKELGRAAKLKLSGRAEAMVSLTSGGKLSNFARDKRKEKRRKQIAKSSRRRNRK